MKTMSVSGEPDAKPFLLDCDPGHDDMVAMMVAIAAADIELLGVTTVAGNQTGEKTALNARRVATLVGEHNLPIAKGCERPLYRELRTAPHIHGKSGLDGADLPEPTVALRPEHAVDFMERAILGSDRPVTLVPTGPLTNVAMLLRKAPQVSENIERIVLMGGSMHESNVTPVAEFNIFVDPEAANAVFTSGLPVTMVGLDVTYRALFGEDDFVRLEQTGGHVSAVVAPLLRFFAGAYEKRRGTRAAPLHDALAVAIARDPSMAETRNFHVAVETQGRYTTGQTVVDTRGVTGNPPNAEVAVEFDLQRFKNIIFEAIGCLDARRSPRG